jgi:putative membrane protein
LSRKIKRYGLLVSKGMAMGAADLIPGVSGGTIAFITGIYEELINTLKSIDLKLIKLLLTFRLKEFWLKLNGSFLLAVFGGIFLAGLTLSRVVTYLLEHKEIQIWSFFFGLIIACTLIVGREIKKWEVKEISAFVIAAALAVWLSITSPAEGSGSFGFIFVAGFISICAMILPGISGSYILLLMGAYRFMLDTLKEFSFKLQEGKLIEGLIVMKPYLAFIIGAVAGLLLFSRFLSWMFRKARTLTLAALTGFMAGSLWKIWPWKEVISTRINSKGEEVPFQEANVLPDTFSTLTGEPNYLVSAVVIAVVGFAIAWFLDKLSPKDAA